MTIAANTIVQDLAGAKKVLYQPKQDGTADINAGDAMYFDSASKKVLPLDSDAHAATFVGIAEDTSFLNPYGTKKYSDGVMARVGCIALRNTVAGDTLNDNDPVYYSTDAQTVTNTVGGNTNIIGYVKLPAGSAAIAGGTGVKVPVLIVAKSPANPLA